MDLYPLIKPLVMRFDPECGHAFAIRALRLGLVPPQPRIAEPVLATRVFGLDFPNPVGLAAGFDKDAAVADAMLAQGFGYVEVGSVTPRPQPGNPKPRLFRLVPDRAVINRMGFNNQGMEAMAARLAARRRRGIVGVNLGKNKDTERAVDDYVAGARRLAPYADYLAVNVSSPNTPGLRALQSREPLVEILAGVRAVLDGIAAAGGRRPPLLLKIAPDLTPEDLADIAAVALGDGMDLAEGETGVDGLIVTNTTWARDGLKSPLRSEQGGLSGAPLMEPSTSVLAAMYRLTQGLLPLVGVGGISTGADAYAKIRAGASLVQLYTAMVFDGPAVGAKVARELAECLKADGFAHVADAVGADRPAVRGSAP
ncbi:quinone-dependent dihydroorotate dehydrogenase [Oleispirillum naphthae]|uniref:quinone-dependent dihydroorotate dehydrogenase n=1 Tax=Oleispirillum naphthae TaxID=2838853 RepID=UPI00308232B4